MTPLEAGGGPGTVDKPGASCQELTNLCEQLWFFGAGKAEAAALTSCWISIHPCFSEANLMNRGIRRWVLGVALSGLAGAVLAQGQTGVPAAPDFPPPGSGDHEHHGRGHRWGHDGWGIGGPGLLGNLRELGLTQAQHEQIHTIMAAAHEQWKDTAAAASDRASWAALANPGDSGYSAAVQAAKQRASNRIQAMSDLQLEVYNVLTPQQKTALVKVLADKSARWEQWQANHAAHGAGPGSN